MRISRLRLEHFKAFDKFTLNLGPNAFLVGPNNAGKSTLIAAIRTAAGMLGLAHVRNPTLFRTHRGFGVYAHQTIADNLGLVTENLRHQFRNQETTFRMTMSNGVELTAVWPERATENEEDDSDYDAYFYLWRKDKTLLRQPRDVRSTTSRIGVIPGLYPINRDERVLESEYVRQHVEGRRSSQHTRNHILAIQNDGQLDDFTAFVFEWLPEIVDLELRARRPSPFAEIELDVFVREAGDRTSKELYWSGDGLQVFIQILIHMWRLREAPVIVLDEPDLYLHADLQRRLVRLLEANSGQTITATHSSEMLAEAPSESVIWVDKSKRAGIRRPDPASLQDLSTQIGSAFNLRLAAALRARAVAFVEGDDMTIMRHLATIVDAEFVATERNCTVIPMKGFSHWVHVEPFQWLVGDFLDKAVEVFVILDRDFRSDPHIAEIETQLRAAGVRPHVWRRKELESYLLEPEVIARVSLADLETVNSVLSAATSEIATQVRARLIADALERQRGSGLASTSVIETSLKEIDAKESDSEWRRLRFPAKEVLRGINRAFAQAGIKTVSATGLARAMTVQELDTEVADVLRELDMSASGGF